MIHHKFCSFLFLEPSRAKGSMAATGQASSSFLLFQKHHVHCCPQQADFLCLEVKNHQSKPQLMQIKKSSCLYPQVVMTPSDRWRNWSGGLRHRGTPTVFKTGGQKQCYWIRLTSMWRDNFAALIPGWSVRRHKHSCLWGQLSIQTSPNWLCLSSSTSLLWRTWRNYSCLSKLRNIW